MKRTVQMGRVGNNLPAPRGQEKNKHRFHELKIKKLEGEKGKEDGNSIRFNEIKDS